MPKRSHKKLPPEQLKHVAYATEALRLEARRKSWRNSKRRSTAGVVERKTETERACERLIRSGAGPEDRRQVLLDILKQRRTA